LSNNTVLSLFHDNVNGLWIGLDDGVNYLQLSSPYTHYASTGGTLGTIYSLLKKDDEMYIGTNHGLFVASIHASSSTFQFRDLRFIENSHGHVWSLYNYNDKVICGHNEGTFIVENNTFIKGL
jgi:AraC family transcriptional regulator, chitin signaling transcriptional activator